MIWVAGVLFALCVLLFLSNVGLQTQLDDSRKRADQLESLCRSSMKLTDDGLAIIYETAASISRVRSVVEETRH
jgi:hypothetical protein